MPFLVDLANGVSDFQYYYGGKGNFSQKPEIPKVKYTAFDDGLIRGGVVNTAISTVRDLGRIGKFFTTTKGFLFATKQIGLQRSNSQLEQNVDVGVTSLLNRLDNNRFYNLGLNTLTQVGVQAFGQHVIRHGVLPRINSTERATGKNSYGYVIWNNNQKTNNTIVRDSSANRLVNFLAKVNYASQKPAEPVILKKPYPGGPNSTYGIGTTSIRTTQIFPGVFTTDYDPSLNTNNISEAGSFQNYYSLDRTSDEARTNATYHSDQLIPENYNIQNIEKRLGASRSRYSLNKKRSVDGINTINVLSSGVFYKTALSAVESNNDLAKDGTIFSDTVTKDTDIDGKFGRDVIKFRLEFLNNDNPVAGGLNTEVLAFRAYINDFNDGMAAKWDSYRYMGRGEEFYIYNGFTRDISVSFTIYAHSPEEMAPIYNKLNYLMSTFTPDYSNNKMRGNIGYLTVGDYLYRQPGVFTDIKLSGMLDTHWEIAVDEPEERSSGNKGADSGQYEVPKHIVVTLSFKPIHTFLPRRNTINKYTAPFITPDVVAYNRGDNKYLPIKQPVKKTDSKENTVTTAATTLDEVVVTGTRRRSTSNTGEAVTPNTATENLIRTGN
jgi:hypothetical protein